jgi:hypothetical protein
VKDAHLTLETMAKWLAGDLDPEDFVGHVAPHLLAHCPICGERYAEIVRLQKEVRHWDERVAVFEGREAPELFAALAGLPFDEQLSLVADDPGFQNWGLCQLLLKTSLEAAFEEPAAAVNLAELAVNIAENLGDAYDPHWVLDLRARAYAYLGNARRVLGELRSAETAFPPGRGLPCPEYDRQPNGCCGDPASQGISAPGAAAVRRGSGPHRAGPCALSS